ncbi:MAG: beta strand repeat-containing protein [Gemmataceae bacterium]
MIKFWLNPLRRSLKNRTCYRVVSPRHRINLESLESREVPAAFTPGNLTVLRESDGTTALANTGNKVFIDEYTPAGALVQSIELPSTGGAAVNRLVINGTSTASGQMQLSGDGRFLSIAGFNADAPFASSLSATTSTAVNRSVYILDATGNLNNSKYFSFSNYASGGDPRAAVTNDGQSIYVSTNSGGVSYAKLGDSTVGNVSNTTANLRNLQIFGGQLYVTSMSGATRLATVGTGVPTTSGQPTTNLPGPSFSASLSPYGMFFCDLDATVPGVDTGYFVDDNINAGFGGLYKLSKDISGNWNFNGTNLDYKNGATSQNLRGLTGSVNGTTVTLYATFSNGSTSAPISGIVKLTDSSGFGNAVNGSWGDGATTAPLVNAPSGTFKTAFRGITFAPNNVQTNVTSITASPTTTTATTVTFTVTFNNVVAGLSASNFSLTTTGDLSGSIGTPTSPDGLTWTVPVTGLVDDGTVRLDLQNTAGITPTPPGNVPFTSGTVVTVDHTLANDYVDVISGNVAIFRGGSGMANGVTVATSGTSVTINDSAGTIALTTAATTAGWTGGGTSTVTGPSGSTSTLKVRLGTGTDTFNLNAENVPLVVTGGGQSGDIANFPVSVTYAGSASFTNFDSISVGASVTIGIDTVTLGATALGASGTPLNTKSKSVTATAGSGGIYLQEADGASFIFNETGGGDVSIGNSSGTLTVGGASTWDTGTCTLSSADGVAVNAAVGTVGTTKGNFVVYANSDGSAGTDGYIQGVAGNIQTSLTGQISITVNQLGLGTGDAVLGTGHTDTAGFTSVNSYSGNILWNPAFTIPTLDVANSQILTSGAFSLQTNGVASSIGTASSPLQLNCNQAVGLTSATAGTGGVYITRYGIGTAQFTASAQGSGNIQLWAGSGSNDGIEIVTPGLSTNGNGTISVRADDAIFVNGNVGGPFFSGSILMEANLDGGSSQRLEVSSGNTITTSNATTTAVILRAYSQDTTSFAVGGLVVGNITTGNGGKVTLDAAGTLGNSTDTIRLGAITQLSNTTIDTGANGSVLLNAKGAWIGKVSQPIRVTTGSVTATTTSQNASVATNDAAGDIYITSTGPSSFAASTGDAFSTSSTTFDRVAVISLTTLAGALTVGGPVTTGYGDISLNADNGIVLNANVGSATTGSMTLNAGTGSLNQTAGVVDTEAGTAPTTPATPTTGTLSLQGVNSIATFNSLGNKATQLVIPQGLTANVNGSFASSGAVQVDGTLGGSGSVGTVTVSGTGKVAPGNSPGKLTTGNITFNTNSIFSVELNGAVAGTGYDQISVNGTVNLGNATLNTSYNGFSIPGGQVFRVIDNDGADAVTGTFNGLPDGATISVGAAICTISYVGGDGNDVTIKAPGVAGVPPTVTSVVLDEGSGNTNINGVNGTIQRSEVRRIIVTFSAPVTFTGANAFSLARSASSLSSPAGGTGAVSLTTNPVSGTTSTVTITFNAGTFVDSTKSLQDGLYNFAIDASKVSNGGGQLDGGAGAGSNYTVTGTTANKMYRFYGDENGDGGVDQTDYLAFRNALSGGPNSVFDSNGDGDVDQTDYLRFRQNLSGAP